MSGLANALLFVVYNLVSLLESSDFWLSPPSGPWSITHLKICLSYSKSFIAVSFASNDNDLDFANKEAQRIKRKCLVS
jgi:hypothetical protein